MILIYPILVSSDEVEVAVTVTITITVTKTALRLVLVSGLISSVLALSACGGGGGSSGSGQPPVEAPPVLTPSPPPGELQTGVIWPVPIGGLRYIASAASGITNEQGEFQYENGDPIEFSLGDTVFASFERGAPQLTFLGNKRGFELGFPFGEVSDILATLDDPAAEFTAGANALRILYSLDDDQNPSNGINISAGVADAFASRRLDLMLAAEDFAYSSELWAILDAADRSLMPLETSLGHHYEAAGLPLSQGRSTLGRKVREGQLAEVDSDVPGLTANTEYTYDALGNLVSEEVYDGEGLLLSRRVDEFDAQGLRTRRSLDFDGDGITDFDAELEHNRAGDVVQEIIRSGPGLANRVVVATTYNALGQAIERAEDRGGDGSVEYTTTTQYASNGRASRIEANSTESDEGEFVIINTFDAADRLIEQRFEGIHLDTHAFLDSQLPPLGTEAVDRFDPVLPYWGAELAVIGTAGPPSPSVRQTTYRRDPQGRVIERSTDSDGDGSADQVAQLVFEGGPVNWRVDAQGDGFFELSARYSYSNEGLLTRVQEQRVLPDGLAVTTRTRTLEYDEHGRRVGIRTVSNPRDSQSGEVTFSYDLESRLSLTRFGDDAGAEKRNPEEIQWQNSFRLDDLERAGLPALSTAAYQFEYRDVGEPVVRDANGVVIGSYAGGDQDRSYNDITMHFKGLPDPYVLRIIGVNLSQTDPDQPGFNAEYLKEDCRQNIMPMVQASDDGTPPRIVVVLVDGLDTSGKPRSTFIADPDAPLRSLPISQRYEGARFGCAPVFDEPVLDVYPMVPTTLTLVYPLSVDGLDLEIEPLPELIVN